MSRGGRRGPVNGIAESLASAGYETVADVAERTGIPPSTIGAWVKRGKVTGSKVSSVMYVQTAEVMLRIDEWRKNSEIALAARRGDKGAMQAIKEQGGKGGRVAEMTIGRLREVIREEIVAALKEHL